MVPGFAEELAFEGDYLGQVRVAFEKRCEFGADEPAYSGVGETSAQGGESGQGLDEVAERAGLYYQDVLRDFLHNRVILCDAGSISNQHEENQKLKCKK